uniref:DDE Tnp4 domain-containing protein n=1 Tax=Picea sitchensis TaxID=3332 RepID=D5ABV0_PICSI|nr:unknown [Picea sitchensis]
MYSVAAQIVVDRDMRILNVSTGYSGGYSDSHVLKLSRMYTEVVSNGLLDGQSLLLHGTEVPLYLIGDLGYPLKTWLLTPYYAQNRSAWEEAFNRKHGQVHSIVSMTSHVLKRWGVLAQKMRVSLKMATATIGACCVLHNMMFDWNEGLELEDYALLHSEQPLQEPEQGDVEIDYEIGRRIRDALAMEVYGQT